MHRRARAALDDVGEIEDRRTEPCGSVARKTPDLRMAEGWGESSDEPSIEDRTPFTARSDSPYHLTAESRRTSRISRQALPWFSTTWRRTQERRVELVDAGGAEESDRCRPGFAGSRIACPPLVKTMENGMPFLIHSAKARSMACGSWRGSMRHKGGLGLLTVLEVIGRSLIEINALAFGDVGVAIAGQVDEAPVGVDRIEVHQLASSRGGRRRARRSFFSARRFNSEDLPTLERPMKANSGSARRGASARVGALLSNTADLIFMAPLGQSPDGWRPLVSERSFIDIIDKR